ncbi:hypothetical protein, partial [Neisseria zoodegmatis]|uniref:hypothetical protein n=1 Tax=Neisseria zoodegmatis TaxID=326523 RepID=UPI001B7FF6A8
MFQLLEFIPPAGNGAADNGGGFVALSRNVNRQHNIAGDKHTQNAVRGAGGVYKKKRRARRSPGGGPFLPALPPFSPPPKFQTAPGMEKGFCASGEKNVF